MDMKEKATDQITHENEKPKLKSIKRSNHPFLIEYRSSSMFIFTAVFITLLSSAYTFCIFIQTTPIIIKNQIENQFGPKDKIPQELIRYILLGFHVLGLIGGSVLFGCLKIKATQRRLATLVGTLITIICTCSLMLASRYWMLLPLQLFLGISGSCIWIMSYSLVIDHCSYENIGMTIGFFYSVYPLGIMAEAIVCLLRQYVEYQYYFITAVSLCGFSFIMQLLMVEKSTIIITWSNEQIDDIMDNTYNSLHLCVEDGQWSKSSSMTTINLKDQPIIIEPEPKNIEITFLFLLIKPRLLASLYQSVIIAAVYSALKATLLYRLTFEWRMLNSADHLLYMLSHMIPCILSFFLSGILCKKFGTKKVGLLSVILSIPTLIWIGIPDRHFSSWTIIPAMIITGFTMAGIQVSILIDMILLVTEQESSDIQKSRGFVKVLALWESFNAIGLFFGSFLSALKIITGHFWFCCTLSCIILTCIPFMYLYMSRHTKAFKRSSSDTFGPSTINSQTRNSNELIVKPTYLIT